MTKRRLIRWSLLLAILAAFAVWLEPTRVVWGLLRGEAFYQGRPTSYWGAELNRWTVGGKTIVLKHGPGWVEVGESCVRSRSAVEQWLAKVITLPEANWPDLLDGDPDARPVLDALSDDSRSAVRDWAEFGLERIRTGEKGAHKSAGTLYSTLR